MPLCGYAVIHKRHTNIVQAHNWNGQCGNAWREKATICIFFVHLVFDWLT